MRILPCFIALALFLLAGCRDRVSFAPTVLATPMPAFAFNGILATYNNPAMGSRETSTLGAIQNSTDRNAMEFPSSSSTAMITTVDAGSGGVGSGRALKFEFALPAQQAAFAGCALPIPCDCATSYAYVAISQQLVAEGVAAMDISGFSTLSFWVKSDLSFSMKVSLNCQGQSRPLTYGPGNAYQDAAFTKRNPCWYAISSSMTPGAPVGNPMAVSGGGTWIKYSIPLSLFNDVSGPGYPCGLNRIREVGFSISRATAADFPSDSGIIYFDDLVFE